MFRTSMMILALAFSSMSTACLDDDSPEDDGPKRSGEDDPDFVLPGDHEPDEPVGCGPQLQDDEDEPCPPPK